MGTNQSIFEASKSGDEARVRQLLASGTDPNKTDKFEKTALHIACEKGREPVVRLLLEAGADITKEDKLEKMALHFACIRGKASVVRLLLEAGVAVHKEDKHRKIPLHYACEKGRESVVRMLLEANADINEKDKRTALHCACQNGHESVVRMLLEAGADINEDECGWTALHKACIGVHYEFSLNAYFGKNNPSQYVLVVRLLLNAGIDVNKDDLTKRTALHYACEKGQESVVGVLLEAGAAIDKRDEYEKTALHCACENGYESVVRLLLEAEADIHGKEIEFGRTALHFACGNGHESIARMLLAAGANCEESAHWTMQSKAIKALLVLASELHTSPYLEGLHLQLSLHEAEVAMENAIAANDFPKVRHHRDKTSLFSQKVEALGLRSDLSQEGLYEKANDILVRLAARFIELKAIVASSPTDESVDKAEQCLAALNRLEGRIAELMDVQYTHSVTDELVKLNQQNPIPEDFDLADFILTKCPSVMPDVNDWAKIMREGVRVAKAKIVNERAQGNIVLSFNQALAIAVYTYDGDNFFNVLNRLLRHRKAKFVKALHPYLHFLLEGLSALPARNEVVYRGIPTEHLQAVKNDYLLGGRIHWSAFTSTSTDIETAKRFAGGTGGVIFRVQVVTGRSVKPYSSVDTEHEILMGPNSRFVVTKACPESPSVDGFYYVELLQPTESGLIF